ncbi:MAG: hypothetical protein QOJ81_1246 [Chloroflexota bacterium]|jgi:hypothetical protein|nr:hypothetical protein [Chloroflexota bacterium]
MGELSIRVGDQNFSARWEAAAPKTRDALRPLLPLRSKLIHCKWSGEGCWIPFGDDKLPVGYENHTSHPAPTEIIVYTGDLSEGEILIAYGGVTFSSLLGQLSGNHFATITGPGSPEDVRQRLRDMGRRVLWEGAQDIVIEELP